MNPIRFTRKKRALVTMITSLCTVVVLLTAQAFFSPSPETTLKARQAGRQGPFAVTRIVDGDTIAINYNDTPESVRFIGIDTPELHHPTKPVQCFAKEAALFTTSLLENKSVYLVFDPSQDTRDKYHRLLAYIYRSDDDLFINKTLIESGYAYEYTYDRPYIYQKEFKALQTFARENQKGLWASETCGGDTNKAISKTAG